MIQLDSLNCLHMKYHIKTLCKMGLRHSLSGVLSSFILVEVERQYWRKGGRQWNENLQTQDLGPTLFTFIQILPNFDNLSGETLDFLLPELSQTAWSFISLVENYFLLKLRLELKGLPDQDSKCKRECKNLT